MIGCGESLSIDGESPSQSSADLSEYFINPEICNDGMGPDCTQLRLGDSQLTTLAPERGKLYACMLGNPGAPGSDRSKITWINETNSTWNLLAKPFLPEGSFSPPIGTSSVIESESNRAISGNNLPVDGKIGDWPMTKYPVLSAIDGNPGIPAENNFSFTLPLNPTEAANPSCVSLGPIGMTLNGVVLYNAVDGRGNDAVAHEIIDVYGGHPAQSDYHYHFVPERLDKVPSLSDGHSGLIGYIRDGFGLYGYNGVGGEELSNQDLDECHGHSHNPTGYHYHSTIEYPYTIGCYQGTPMASASAIPPKRRIRSRAAGPLSGVLSSSDPESTIGAIYREANVRFIQGMITHHAQALEMTALVRKHASTEAVRQIARRMEISQRHEIELMEAWLSNNGESLRIPSLNGQMPIMAGMLTPEQMQELSVARGAGFDKLFLKFMIEHHSGANEMVANLSSASRVEKKSTVFKFAEEVDVDQAMEIQRMLAILEGIK
jgi:uncharacterized protein (DUF305 family)